MMILLLAAFLCAHAQAEPTSSVVEGKVIFPVSRYVIPAGTPFLNQLTTKTLPDLQEKGFKLTKIEIVGTASPEGTREHNKQLSERRNKALLDTISRLVTLPANVQSEVVIEDYAGLLQIMKDNNDRNYSAVLNIYNRYSKNEIDMKRRLRIANGGKLWRYLLKTYYPDLRTAKVKMYFELPAPAPQPEPQPEPQPQPQPQPKPEPQPAVTPVDTTAQATPAIIDEPATDIDRVHLLSLKTNLLHDVFYMPNYGWAPTLNIRAEYYPLNGHYTYNAAFTFPYYHRWSKQKFYQIRDYELSVRRYFKPAVNNNAEYLGWYLGAYGHYTKYGIGFNKDKGWEGEGGGFGIEGGYVMNISKNKRWRLEFSAGIGFFYTLFDPYVYGNPVNGLQDGFYYYDYTDNASKFKRRNHKSFLPDPTHLGVTLTYDLLYRKQNNKGVSVHRKEAMVK